MIDRELAMKLEDQAKLFKQPEVEPEAEAPYRLDDVHLEAAKKMAQEHCRDKNCRKCYGRGWIGTNQYNELITCRCLNSSRLNFDWYLYLKAVNDPVLNERYAGVIEHYADVEKHMERQKLVAGSL